MRGALIRAGLVLVGCTAVFTQDLRPSFDAASIKPAEPLPAVFAPGTRRVCPLTGCGGPGTGDPGRITFISASLNNLVQVAYGVRPYQVDTPGWMNEAKFDIEATFPPSATREQVNLMLQNLLSDRFQLKLHRTTKELPIYALAVAKGGSKLKASPSERPPGVAKGRGTIFLTGADGPRKQFEFDGMTLARFADTLSPEVDRPVIDRTGLAGNYDVRLEFAPQRNIPVIGGVPLSTGSAGAPLPQGAPELFTALTEQLGLKLEPTKGPVAVLVVDSAARQPTEN